MTETKTIREALEAYVKVAKELHWEGWSSADRHAKLAQKALRLFDELVKAEPVARVAGYYGGRCVIEPINPAAILPVGAALCYTK